MSTTEQHPRPSLDKGVFWPGVLMILVAALAISFNPEPVRIGVKSLLAIITGQFGWLLLLFGFFSFVSLGWLAFGRYGHIKLGGPEEEPEFSNFSWVCMIFCAAMGISIINWSFVEPVFLMHDSPLGVEPGSPAAIEYAAMYSQFHWGLVPWAIYTIASIPVAYCLYVRKEPFLRFSTASKPVLGDYAGRWPGKVIDLVVAFSILGGVGTSLGLSVPLVSTLLSSLTGVEESFTLKMMVLILWTALFSYSAYKGLGKGIRVLSDINISLAFLLLLFVLAVGPTVFILKLWSNSLGLYLDNFFRITLWTDPVAKTGFTEKWTVFYWAWWVAYAPMMALFIARISRGRTIREVIVNEIFWGTVGCMTFFAIWGGYSLYLETHNLVPVNEILNKDGIPDAVVAILQTLPGGNLTLGVFTVLSFIFLATTLDSAAYTLASVSTKNLSGYQEPARWNRLLWAFLIALTGLALLVVGGLDIIQASTLVVSLPMVAVLLLLCWALLRDLRADERMSISERSTVLAKGIGAAPVSYGAAVKCAKPED